MNEFKQDTKGSVLIIAALFIIFLLAVGLVFWQYAPLKSVKEEHTWENCEKNPKSIISLSYPSVCYHPDGWSVIQKIAE